MTQLAFELPVNGPYCQRWRHQRHRWRADRAFDPARYAVEPIGEPAAQAYVVDHHYSASYNRGNHRYGLLESGRLVGVAVLANPMQSAVLTNVLPDLEPYVESLELSRFVLADSVPANGESWFLARCFEQAAGDGVRGVVSFADPVPRRVAGRLIFPGHVGWIYQASNALYTGRSTARTHVLLPDGRLISPRTLQKLRAGERGHDSAERQLVGLGARPLRLGERPASWLAEALDQVGAVRLRHRGCHRYVFRLGGRSQRRRIRVTPPLLLYPKTTDP
jgi:hypothetical protein